MWLRTEKVQFQPLQCWWMTQSFLAAIILEGLEKKDHSNPTRVTSHTRALEKAPPKEYDTWRKKLYWEESRDKTAPRVVPVGRLADRSAVSAKNNSTRLLEFDATPSQSHFSINSCRRPVHYGAKSGASNLHDHNRPSATSNTKHNPPNERSIRRDRPFSPHSRRCNLSRISASKAVFCCQ